MGALEWAGPNLQFTLVSLMDYKQNTYFCAAAITLSWESLDKKNFEGIQVSMIVYKNKTSIHNDMYNCCLDLSSFFNPAISFLLVRSFENTVEEDI